MRPHLALFVVACSTLMAGPVVAADGDGPDCGRAIEDFGDAPEALTLPNGAVARFPTCLAPTSAGTIESACPPPGSPPGPTGYVRHLQSGTGNYWLGCFTDAGGALYGIDSEPDGKVSVLPSLVSACNPAVGVDCPDRLGFWAKWGQDERAVFNSDGGIDVYGYDYEPYYYLCSYGGITMKVANCGPPRMAYLNVLVDLNLDGDWNDTVDEVPCSGPCQAEWTTKNLQVSIPNGCRFISGDPFFAGPLIGEHWMRVTLTDQPVGDDFPWAGSANQPGGAFVGGETEDYIVIFDIGDPAKRSAWGTLKLRYR
jgi:hypothetical protein